MWLSVSQPQFLLLLPVAAALLWYSARVSYADLSGARRWIAWSARGLIVLALILALAGAQLVKRSDDMVVVFVVDASYSVPRSERAKALGFIKQALQYRRAQDRAALVFFGREANVESEALRSEEDVRVTSKPAPTHTDLAAGMRLALGLLPPGAAGKLVLFSDGNENVGSVAGELLWAQANKVPVDIVPLEARMTSDVLVRDVTMPSEARRGEPFPVQASLEATGPAEATLTVLVDDQPVERRQVTLGAGATTLRIPVSVPEPGFHKIDVLLDAAGDQCRQNDQGTGFVRIKGKPRVLMVDQDPGDLDALKRSLQVQDVVVEVGGPAALPTNVADLQRYDSVFLSNYPAYKMSHQQMVMMRDATRDLGIGLGMIGGEMSFGAGGYYRTPVEEALPVSMDISKHRTFPSAAVLIVMDTSGSMGMLEDGVEKIQLAAEAACAVADLLQPYDSIGFIASDPAPTEVLRLRKVQNKSAIKGALRSVRAGGGGIAVFPSLSAAYNILERNNSSIRHIILLADGSDCDQQGGSVQLVQEMAAQKMTITAIAFGNGPHVPFLKDVARAGDGQYYLTERARDLKKIFTRETLTVAKSVLVEEQFQARPADTSAITQGVDWSSAPPLLGYVATTPKSLARVPLVSHKEEPVLAHWQYGLGRSVAFASDAKAHWAAYWLGWREFPKFWGQAVRWSLRQLSSGVLYPRVEPQGDKAKIVVEAVAEDGTLLGGLEMRANVNLPDGTREQILLEQTAPGSYSAFVSTPVSGPYVVALVALGPDGFSDQQTLGFAMAYPPDFADTQSNEPLLQNLADQTGGEALTGPEQVFVPPKQVPSVPIDIWRLLLWLAAVLLPIDVGVRRLVVRREDLMQIVAAVASLTGRLRRRRRPEEPTAVAHLLTHIKSGREQREAAKPSPPTIDTTRPTPEPKPEPGPVPEPPSPAAPTEPEEEAAQDTVGRLLERKRKRNERED